MPTALVTGANKGIGLALCSALAARGWAVLAACRRPSPELELLGLRVVTGADVGTDEGEAILRRAAADAPLELVVANAGVATSGALEDLDIAALRHEYEVNALGALRTVRAALPSLGPGSKIALISSRAGSIGDNRSGGAYGYRMAKAALNMLGVTLARDLEPRGIAVVVLHPGVVATDVFAGSAAAQRIAAGMEPVLPEDVAAPLLDRIEESTVASTGRFLTRTGEEIPW